MVGEVVNEGYDGSEKSVIRINNRLHDYANIIDRWAINTAEKMFHVVNLKNTKEWKEHSKDISRELKWVLENTPVGQVARDIVDEQVNLIKSLPIQAADRVTEFHNRAFEALINGERSSVFAEEIYRTGLVTLSRANLIARTEMGKAHGALDQARALSVGSEGYIWRTADDRDVRDSHDEMNGKFVYWANPPTLDGMTGHAGCLPHCRCWREIVLPSL